MQPAEIVDAHGKAADKMQDNPPRRPVAIRTDHYRELVRLARVGLAQAAPPAAQAIPPAAKPAAKPAG